MCSVPHCAQNSQNKLSQRLSLLFVRFVLLNRFSSLYQLHIKLKQNITQLLSVPSVSGRTSSRLLGGLTGNQTKQDFSDWIQLRGIDEGIGAHVRICQKGKGIIHVSPAMKYQVRMQGYNDEVDMERQPRDGVACADKNHRFDHV